MSVNKHIHTVDIYQAITCHFFTHGKPLKYIFSGCLLFPYFTLDYCVIPKLIKLMSVKRLNIKKITFFIQYLLLLGVNLAAKAQTNQTVSNGSFSQQVVFPAGTCGYTWTNSNPAIGLPIAGKGNIASFKATNTGTIPITATITATPVSGSLAFIANSGSNDVSVFNTGSKSVVATIPVGRNPFGAAVSPNGQTVYITNKDDNTVSVINAYTNTVTATIPVGRGPQGIAASPDGQFLYVACGIDDQVAVVDLTARTVVSSIDVGQNPYGVEINKTGDRIYVTNFNGNSLSVIDVMARDAFTTFTIGYNPAGMALSPNGGILYVANSGIGSITLVNTLDNTIIKQVTIPNSHPHSIIVRPDGTRVIIGSISGFMSFYDPPPFDQVFGTASPPAFGMAYTPDNSEFYYTDYAGRLSYTAWDLGSGGIISPFGNKPTSFGKFIAPGLPCSMPNVSFTITVNPSPNIQVSVVSGNITTCEGTASSNPNIQSFSVSGSTLTNNITIAAPANFELSLTATGGYGNNIILPATAGVVNNTTIYVRSAATAPPGALTANITCTSDAVVKQVPVSATINALPVVNTVNDQTLSAGQTTTTVSFTGTGTAYNWVNNTPGIGLAANGSGNIGSFTAVNTTNSPITATVTVTPSSASCAGLPATFKITVNPAPVITVNSNLSQKSSEFGSAPFAETFTASGTNLSAGITVTAPANFELSLDNTKYNGIVTIGNTGNVADTTLYVRLKLGSSANTYGGDIVLNSTGAKPVNITIPNYVVTPAPLTITADDVFKTYGESLQSNATSSAFKITSGSLKNNNTLSTVSISYGAGAAAKANVGSYPNISALVTSGGNGFSTANYAISYVKGNINVQPAALTITADNKSKIYKAPTPLLTLRYSGFVNNENDGVLTMKPILSTVAEQASMPGDYRIFAAGANAANYTIAYIDGILTILPAPIQIVATNGFTPNGDGINDVWDIPALSAYPNCTVKVYSRSGKLVFQSVGYSKPWDGTYANAPLATGTYYYLIEPKNNQKTLSGSLTIIR